MPIMQVEHPPQPNLEPEMGAGAAAVYDTPPLPGQNPSPVPSETAADNGGSGIAQLILMMQAMSGDMQEMNNKMDTNAQQIKNEMKNEMKNQMEELRGEMQRIGRGLQAGLMAIACDETTEHKMAAPRAGANELRGSVDCVGPAVEDKVIRETCKTRLVQVTEKVTVTEREKLNGMTEMCIRHVKTKEIELTETRRETQELKEITETREIEKVEERLHDKDGVKDEHTHMELVEAQISNNAAN